MTSVRGLRRDAAENRERLIAAAHELFGCRGEDVTVEEIARLAGVGMGTLYRRFPTKESLLTALAESMLDQLTMLARAELALGDAAGLERFLVAASELHVTNRGCLLRVWNHTEEADLDELRSLMAQLLGNAQRGNAIRAEATPTDITVIFWAVRGIIQTSLDVAPDAWRRHLEILLVGLRPGDPLSSAPLTEQHAQAIRATSR